MDAASPSRGQPTAPAATAPRRRPFGLLVVALIQIATVGLALLASLTSLELPWEGVFVTYLQENAWARGVILAMGAAVIVAVIGMWQLRYWGWALMVSIVGASLLLDLVTWWRTGADTGLSSYARLAMDVVSAFYLNTTAVQDAFRAPPEPTAPPTAGTSSAGRVDP